MIDEYPILAALAASAEGMTTMRGIRELRVKESDRIDAMARGLEACGVKIEEGAGLPHRPRPRPRRGDRRRDGGEPARPPHRHVLPLPRPFAARAPIAIDDAATIATSFPSFIELMRGLGGAADVRFTVAIDGPAASGKGTIGRAVAARFGFAHLDTGLLYRAVGVQALHDGRGVDRPALVGRAGPAAGARGPRPRRPALGAGRAGGLEGGGDARGARPRSSTSSAASPAREGGAVLDGRDIGTVICPEAEAKLFVTASDEARAARRQAELGAASFEEVLADLRARDARDAGRDVAPMRRAKDALLLDTTDFSIDAAVAGAVAYVESRVPKR